MIDFIFDVLDSGFDAVIDNPIRSIAVATTVIASGGTALLAAPTIGAVVSAAGFGVAGGTLSGAAASSAGLAALGGGSLAAGGAGIAGGTTVVTAVGSSVGAGVSKLIVPSLAQ